MRKIASITQNSKGVWVIHGIIGRRMYCFYNRQLAMRKYAEECHVLRKKKGLI